MRKTMLHIINQFPIEPEDLNKTASGDTVVLTKAAIEAAKRSTQNQYSFINKAFAHINLCVLKTELTLTGISKRELIQGVAVLDEQDFRSIANEGMAFRSLN